MFALQLQYFSNPFDKMSLTTLMVFFSDTLLSGYLNCHQFSELHLDGIFKYGDDNTLPVEVCSCWLIHANLIYDIKNASC
jgi:hypothetical protein